MAPQSGHLRGKFACKHSINNWNYNRICSFVTAVCLPCSACKNETGIYATFTIDAQDGRLSKRAPMASEQGASPDDPT